MTFAIVSNNCWGTGFYQENGLQYNTPTVGLWFYADDYLSFLRDLRSMNLRTIEFRKYSRRGERSYPVGVLENQSEVQFMHYASEEEARRKWTSRVQRLPSHNDDLLVKIDDREGFDQACLLEFANLPFRHKVAFVKAGMFDVKSFSWVIEIETPDQVVESGVLLWTATRAHGKFNVATWAKSRGSPLGRLEGSMSYSGLEGAHDASTPHLGGNIKVGDPFTWCPRVWDYLIDRFGIETAMDVGSGGGYAAAHMHLKGVKVIAFDGYEPTVRNAIYPTILHDLTKGPLITRVDLVHCQEVVEHIEAEFLDNLTTTLLSGKIICMTHGVPGQLGYHHVNLQHREYWVEQMSNQGAVLLVEDSERVRKLAAADGAPYMAETGLVFANTRRF